ncbi:MAG: hypothetical protein ACYDH6_03205 [Acidimicrobiales bacterium]
MSADSVELRNVASANGGMDDARYTLREAVVAARLAGHSWAEIGLVLDVSRQAASERFGCDEQVAKAWLQVEILLGKIGGSVPGHTPDPLALLDELSKEGRLHPLDVRYARELRDARNRAVHGGELTVEEAERVTEHAIPLVGNLYSLAHPT